MSWIFQRNGLLHGIFYPLPAIAADESVLRTEKWFVLTSNFDIIWLKHYIPFSCYKYNITPTKKTKPRPLNHVQLPNQVLGFEVEVPTKVGDPEKVRGKLIWLTRELGSKAMDTFQRRKPIGKLCREREFLVNTLILIRLNCFTGLSNIKSLVFHIRKLENRRKEKRNRNHRKESQKQFLVAESQIINTYQDWKFLGS